MKNRGLTLLFVALVVIGLAACVSGSNGPTPAIETARVQAPVGTFKDCADCPAMVVIPAGSFDMGDLDGSGSVDEGPIHRVSIDRPFAVGKFEVTQTEWVGLMKENPAQYRGDRLPVYRINWNEAVEFVQKLSRKTGKTYRLLSEAEWEYVARAGSKTTYPWGDWINPSMANYGGYGTGSPKPVGSYEANAFGLCDVVGNAWEWVEDCWNENYEGAPTDGSAWMSGNCDAHVLRGGAWFYHPRRTYTADRLWNYSGVRTAGASFYGLRVARELD